MNPEQFGPVISDFTPPAAGGAWKWPKFVAIAVVVVVAAGLIGYFGFGIGRSNSQEDEEHKYEATVAITQNGFQPATLTVRPDTRVYFESQDGQIHRLVPNSAPNVDHPFALGSEQGPLEEAGGYAYSFHAKGVYTFHDASNPTQNGQVIVE